METSTSIPDALLTALRDARHVCALTGAGVSAESGVPTFRDAQEGLWAKYNPLELATPDAFEANPRLVWQWYAWRREQLADVQPNPGHTALAEMEKLTPVLTLITQNVDGLHQRAGNNTVIEFHSNIFDNHCFQGCGLVDPVGDGEPPVCPKCGGMVRPGVVWFGESIPEQALDDSFAAAADCDVFFSIGTSATVYPAAGLVGVAREAGAVCVEINPEPTGQADFFDYAIAGKSGEILPKLLELLAD